VAVPAPPAAPAAPDLEDDGWETCTIAWSRGYRKSDFYAVAASGDEMYEVARSPMFRWRSAHQPPADSEGIFEAHSDLVDRLKALGWEEAGGGRAWYERRFRRPATAES
jgi:hypothetical protein